MRDHMRAVLAVIGTLAGCGPSTVTTTQNPPTVVVTVEPVALTAMPALTLDDATLRLDHVHVFGDTPPSMTPPVGPPPNPTADRLDLDALSTTGGMVTFTVPVGLYSRVELEFQNVVVDGKSNGTTFHARLASVHGPRVDLRAATPIEAPADGMITFAVTVDPNQWFANAALDGATADPATGEIFVDDLNNPTIASKVTMQIAGSFALQ